MHVQVGSQLGDRLAACAATGALNLSTLTASALAKSFLPMLLPPEWRGQAEVSWGRHSHEEQGFICSEAWLKSLWQRLAQMPDLSPLSEWPLVPVQGRRLCQAAATAQVSHVCHVSGLKLPWAITASAASV